MNRSHWNFENVIDYNKRFLETFGLRDIFYKSMLNKDLSDALLLAKSIIQLTEVLDPIEKTQKCELKSLKYRKEGNIAYKEKKYIEALEYYNEALSLAPIDSAAMVLAYSNRSAVTFTLGLYVECLKDIEKCFEINCPPNIIAKLKERKKHCLFFFKHVDVTKIRYEKFCREYFKLDVKRNPQIPCASSDVGVIIESGLPKVVATKNVAVGTLLAIDTIFCGVEINKRSCYYCQNRNLNLIPCDGCNRALFCGENCKVLCMKEFHAYECSMMEFMHTKISCSQAIVSFKMTLKLRNKFKSWNEFAEASHLLGMDRIKNSKINEIFDISNKFCMLTYKDDQLFIYGKLYNYCFYAAVLMHYLIDTGTYFPLKADESESAIRGFSRVLMYNIVHMSNYMALNSGKIPNKCISPFIGKLKFSCVPNVIAVQLNENIALIALQPLKPNMELTISLRYPTNHLAFKYNKDDYNICTVMLNFTCQCVICDRDFMLLPKDLDLPEHLKQKIENYKKSQLRPGYISIKNEFLLAAEMLTLIKDYPLSDEYMAVWSIFIEYILNIRAIYYKV